MYGYWEEWCYKWYSSFVVCENNLFIMVKFGCMLECKSDSIVLEKWILLECKKKIFVNIKIYYYVLCLKFFWIISLFFIIFLWGWYLKC